MINGGGFGDGLKRDNMIKDHLDWVGIKLAGTSLFLGVITGQVIMMVLAGLASISTILYNVHKYYKDKNGSSK